MSEFAKEFLRCPVASYGVSLSATDVLEMLYLMFSYTLCHVEADKDFVLVLL